MNTKFKILWFEDNADWYMMEKIRVDDILKSHYLESSIDWRKGDDFDIKSVTSNDYDLILMDFKLADDTTGDMIASSLRENNILTDILFYSSEDDTMIQTIKTKNPMIDGVYLTKRDANIFSDKVEKLIEKIVKRSEDIVNLRGFVLDNTSGFEQRIKDIINDCWQKFDVNEKEILNESVSKKLDEKLKRVTKEIDERKPSSNMVEDANKNNYLLTTYDRLDVFQEAVNILFTSYGLPSSICYSGIKNYYCDKINSYRNKLGHIKIGENQISINGENITIDQNLHRQLRKNIKEVDEVIGIIEKCVKAIN